MSAKTDTITIEGFKPCSDGSGAPCLVKCGPYVFAADFLGGRVMIRNIRPSSGSRLESKIAARRCEAHYRAKVTTETSAEWLRLNREMYASE